MHRKLAERRLQHCKGQGTKTDAARAEEAYTVWYQKWKPRAFARGREKPEASLNVFQRMHEQHSAWEGGQDKREAQPGPGRQEQVESSGEMHERNAAASSTGTRRGRWARYGGNFLSRVMACRVWLLLLIACRGLLLLPAVSRRAERGPDAERHCEGIFDERCGCSYASSGGRRTRAGGTRRTTAQPKTKSQDMPEMLGKRGAAAVASRWAPGGRAGEARARARAGVVTGGTAVLSHLLSSCLRWLAGP